MIEFVLKNRRLRLHPDGVMYCRAHRNGQETKKEKWFDVKFFKHIHGYNQCNILIDGRQTNLREHRIVYYAHNQDWDIWDTSRDNCIDHINHKRDDNSIENLRLLTYQHNHFNRSVFNSSSFL